MSSVTMTRASTQVIAVGNYQLSGKVLGKGHFARVEEATHRLLGKKVAIKIIDLTQIKEEYAQRNLHREPRVMSKLRHPCIAALYETMMHGPRLYVVMEAAGGGDLCAHVLATRCPSRGLPESRARLLATQLVSAVRHMHCRGVVHRDLKMENIMLDSTKQFIKIVDFGLSNVWSSSGALRTPCGSLEYAAPELFVDGRKYGPEVDLWSIGVIVFGMVTGGLPFTAPSGQGDDGRDRSLLRQTISRGFGRKHKMALTSVSSDCESFIRQLLEPDPGQRMKIEEASKHKWIRKPGLVMKLHPFGNIEIKVHRETYRQISDLCSISTIDVASRIRADPFGSTAGIYNIKTHHFLMQQLTGIDTLWTNEVHETEPNIPPLYRQRHPITEVRPITAPSLTASKYENVRPKVISRSIESPRLVVDCMSSKLCRPLTSPAQNLENSAPHKTHVRIPMLPCIDEQPSLLDVIKSRSIKPANLKMPITRRSIDEKKLPTKINVTPKILNTSSVTQSLTTKKSEFYRKAGDCLMNWRNGTPLVPLKSITPNLNGYNKRASLANITSPVSTTNSNSRSDKYSMNGWHSSRAAKESPHLQRYKRTAPIKINTK